MTIIERLEEARDKDQAELNRILAKYEGGGMYSSDDSSTEDYLDGKIVAYDHAIQLLKGEG